MSSSLTKALEWFDTTLATLLTRYYQSIGFLPNSENCGPMDVELELELPCEQDFVSDRQTHRLQLPGLQDDFHFFWEPSNFDGMLDAISSADGPLCIAPKAGFYDLSSYEVCCHSGTAFLTLTRIYPSASLPASLRLHIVAASLEGMYIRQRVQE